jgi:hypothetical protein
MHPQIFSPVVTRRSGIARGFGRAAWLGAAAVTALTGCGPQLQTQIVGRSTAFAGPPNPSAPAVAAEIPVPESHSAQVLRYVVALPRAVQLHYQVACPTALREGTLGETFDAYRTRRLADLERERQAQARLIGSLVGAVAPPVRAQASASASAAGPGGSATVAGEIDPGAAAAEAARQSLPPPRLPPGDTGAAVVRGTVDLGASQAGRCLLTLTTDPAAQDASGAQLFLELVRMVDVEAEDRARQAAFRAEQDGRAIALRVWLVGSLQRAGADPMARARARAAAQARAEDEARRRQAAADEETRRRQAAADDANRRQHDAQARADQERWRQDQARLAKENEARAKTDQATAARQAQEGRVRQAAFAVRWELLARLQRLGADPMARERARAAALARAQEDARRKQMTADDEIRRRQAAETLAAQERARREQGRLARERAEAAERERREAPERERRATAERERLAREEAERQARESAEMKRVVAEADARASAEREAGDRRARAWRARQAAVALRWELLARLQRLGADPLSRQHLEEARVAARLDEQRRQYEARARRELNAVVARRAAVDLRFGLVARLQAMGADPDFRRKRDEAMFREMDAQARHLESARAEAAERVRWETQAAIDLRVMAKLRLRQQGAVDRPTCPPPPAETPPPAPFAGATWIQGRYDWTGIAWVWASGHYERPPELGTVWVPPAQIAVSGTLVVRPGRWVRVTVAPPR